MLAKIVLVLFLAAILVALFSGLAFLIKDPSDAKHRRTVKALTWRVALQLALIGFLVLAYFMGWLRPHGFGE
ncbi:MAG: twin transmembrane helix small protein [Gammaproteobacteria bacterium]|nr:twin transmembrane helix small protein [Gammaproteobacteria bacterium]